MIYLPVYLIRIYIYIYIYLCVCVYVYPLDRKPRSLKALVPSQGRHNPCRTLTGSLYSALNYTEPWRKAGGFL